MPGMRPGGPMPNFMMSMVQQGQQPQRPAGRRAGTGGMQQPMPMGGQQQVVSCIKRHYSFSFFDFTCPVLVIIFGGTDLNFLYDADVP